MSDVRYLKSNAYFTPHPSRLRRAAFPSRGRLKAGELSLPLLPDAISSVLSEHFLLVCKRKRSQKKSTRAVPARHPTAAAQTRTRRLFSPCSAHAPANSLSLRQCGLVRSALPPVPSPLSGSSVVCAVACGGWCADCSWDFLGGQFSNRPIHILSWAPINTGTPVSLSIMA